MSELVMAGLETLAGKYLTFSLDRETYGLEILKIQEIIGLMSVTRIPRSPAFIRGIINLRGRVIPVIELRKKFELDDCEDTEKTCIIVVQIEHKSGTLTMGIIVDEVAEVLDIDAKQIEPAPEFGFTVNTDFILGVGKINDKVVMLLDADQVLSDSELQSVARTS